MRKIHTQFYIQINIINACSKLLQSESQKINYLISMIIKLDSPLHDMARLYIGRITDPGCWPLLWKSKDDLLAGDLLGGDLLADDLLAGDLLAGKPL